MADIPGIKQIRCIKQRPVMTHGGVVVTYADQFFLEITFEDGALQNIKVDQTSYTNFLLVLGRQPGCAISNEARKEVLRTNNTSKSPKVGGLERAIIDTTCEVVTDKE